MELAGERHGFIRAADLRERGLDPKRLIDYSQRGLADHLGHGLYRLKLVPPGMWDEFMLAMLWPEGRGVLSHETALDLHGLCDVNPNHIDVTVPKAYRTHRPVPALYRFHWRELATSDVGSFEGMRIVTPARAIADGIDAGLRPTLIEQAIDTAEREAMITGEVAGRLHATLTAPRPGSRRPGRPGPRARTASAARRASLRGAGHGDGEAARSGTTTQQGPGILAKPYRLAA